MVLVRVGLFSGLLLSMLASGCVVERPLSPQGRKHLDDCVAAYNGNDDRAVIVHADAVLAENQKSEQALQARYLRGMARFRQKQHSQAEEDLQFVARKSDNRDLKVRAWDTLGELYYQNGKLSEARKYLEDVVAEGQRGKKPTDHAHYRLGCILQRQGKWHEADVHFQRVMYLFEGTDLAKQARLRAGGRKWTIQVASFASKANAQAQAKNYRYARTNTTVEPVLRDGKLRFLLQVGRWTTYEPAATMLSRVRRNKADAFLHVTR